MRETQDRGRYDYRDEVDAEERERLELRQERPFGEPSALEFGDSVIEEESSRELDERGSDPRDIDPRNLDERGSDERGSDERGSDERGSDERGSDERGSDEPGSDDEFEPGESPAAANGGGEDAPAGRRRHRRRRGRRGVTREDAFLGIERLSTEDIVDRGMPLEPGAASFAPPDSDEPSTGEEITAIEIGGETDNGERVDREPSDAGPKRRRRRRRGRRTKEPADESQRDDAGAESDDPDEQEPRRPRSEQVRAANGESDDDDDDDGDDGSRPNKNLHREVTPWAEAIGFIVNANMEARGRSGGDGGRGRWGKR